MATTDIFADIPRAEDVQRGISEKVEAAIRDFVTRVVKAMTDMNTNSVSISPKPGDIQLLT